MPHPRRGTAHGRPWYDPKLGYRNDPEYRRQRNEALAFGGDAEAIERRWAKRWAEKLRMLGCQPTT